MFRDKRPDKRLRLAGPAPYTRSSYMRVRLEWSQNPARLSGEVLLLLDSGATGAVLSSDWIKNAQVPCCNEPTIGSYNDYQLSPNSIPRGNLSWYGLVYLVYT